MNQGTRQPHFLDDISILDVTGDPAAPCSKLLADLGVHVTRIGWPGHDGQETWNALIREADVLIDSNVQGSNGNHGPEPGHVSSLNPRLIHLSITPFGQTGPRRFCRWSNAVVSAFGGQTCVTGPVAGPPVTPFGNQSYFAASLFGAVAVLLALQERDVTGKGSYIDLSANEALVSTLDHVMVDYFSDGAITRRKGGVYGDHAFAILPCKDGFVQITILQNWETLCELMAAEGVAGDLTKPEWQDGSYRHSHFDHVLEIVASWAVRHGKDELFRLGQAMRFPWAPVASLEDVLRSPQLAARGFFTRDATSDTLRPGPPYRFTVGRPVSQAGPRRSTGHALLSGVRIIDFSRMLAGPYATRILADFGAEVIKVQSEKTATGGEDNGTTYFATWNRNKRSITLDMARPEARRIITELVAKSDVVFESFSPRVMGEWGLTYQQLQEVKPDIIMASISAMGQTGPWRDYVGFGPTFHALSGLLHSTSQGLDTPISIGHAYSDTIIGLYAVLGILSALRLRDRTGRGTYIDLSGYEAACTLLGPALVDRTTEHQGGKDSTATTSFFPSGCFPCQGGDRWCVIDVRDRQDWKALLRIHGLGALADIECETAAEGPDTQKATKDIISAWTTTHSAEEAVQILLGAGINAGVVQDAADLARDPQLLERAFFVRLIHPQLGEILSDRTPLAFDRPEPSEWLPAPLLGADNECLAAMINDGDAKR